MGQQLAGWSSAKSRAERGQGGRHCRCASCGSEALARQQAKREDKRWDKVAGGMQELSLWMQDMVRTGLANQAGDSQTRQHWNTMAARMVDAQATGMAARIREAWELVDSHPTWPRDLLVQLGHWQLLVDAVQRRDSLSPR
jgi:hypothetical protein